MKKFFAVMGVVFAVAAVFFTIVYQRGKEYDAAIGADIAALLAGAAKPGIAFSPAQVKGSPAPVKRYFAVALKNGAGPVRIAKARLGGVIMTHPHGSWLNTGAEEYFDGVKPGFVWHAKLRLSNIVWLVARIQYAGGAGWHEWKTYGAFGGNRIAGAEEDASLLSRYLCESVLLPTALLPGERVKWEALSDTSARATLKDGATAVTAVFHFNEKGEVARCVTDGLFGTGKEAQKLPWILRTSEYKEFGGMMIPTELTAEWTMGKDTFEYAKFTVLEAKYNEEGRFPPVKRKRKAVNPLGAE